MLSLRSVVKNIPLLVKALAGCRSQLLQLVQEVASFPLLPDLTMMTYAYG